MRIDLTGEKFGLLTVVKEVLSNTCRRKWLCKCECGNETVVTTGDLRSGHTKSCGCLRHRENAQDLTGLTFGKLRVIKRVGTSNSRKAMWQCKCECGKRTIVRSSDLLSGNTKSCGCLHKNFAKTHPFEL